MDAEARQEAIAKATGKQFGDARQQQEDSSSSVDDGDDESSSGGETASGDLRRGGEAVGPKAEGPGVQTRRALVSGGDDEEQAATIAPALEVGDGGESTAGTEKDRAEIAALLAEEKVRPMIV